MRLIKALLGAAAIAIAATSAQAATIDRMNTFGFGTVNASYQPVGTVLIFGSAVSYQLSDGNQWWAGAGWAPITAATVSGVSIVGDELIYALTDFRFDGLGDSNGLLFANVDFGFGDQYSAQGELGLPTSMTISAKQGSSLGVMRGYTKIVSNLPTWYGESRFNYYSAPVGSDVYFEQTFQLHDTTFAADLFASGGPEVRYEVQGFVDFKNVAAVPEPTSVALFAIGLSAIALYGSRRGSRPQASRA
jgi:PEP-CTERM motif